MNELIAKLKAFDEELRKADPQDIVNAAASLVHLQHAWKELDLLKNMIQIAAEDRIDALEVAQRYGGNKAPDDYYESRAIHFGRNVFSVIHSNPVTHNLKTTEEAGIVHNHFKMWIIPFIENTPKNENENSTKASD